MPKIKISEIKSENVKKIFRLPMSSRSLRFLESLTLTNDDIIETIEFAEKEYHSNKRSFFQDLVKTQHTKLKFNRAAFNVLVNNLFEKDRLLELINNSEGLTKEDKIEFIGYGMTTAAYFFLNYFVNGESKSVDIDVFSDSEYASEVFDRVMYKDSSKFSKESIDKLILLLKSLDSKGTEKAKKRLKQAYSSWLVLLAAQWEDMPLELLEIGLEDRAEYKYRVELAKHKNAPEDVKAKFYEQTGDEIYLPNGVKDIFLF